MSMDGIREPEAVHTSDRAMLASFLVALFVAGPTLGLIGLALPHAEDAHEVGMVAIAGVSYVIAALTYLYRRRLPEWTFEVAAGLGSLLISAGIYFSGSATTTGAFYYLWVILAAAYFFDRPRVAIQLLIVAVGYAVALALKPATPGMVQAWIVAVGTLAIAAALFVITRERVAGLVARLAQAADTDPLTELLNRRGFGKQFELELERAERAGSAVSLIIGDLDHFKQVNDRFGHQVGDQVLVQVSEVLRRHARRIDCVARVGGEEFALLLPSTDSRGAFVSAERLRYRVREALAATQPGLTISFGVASYPTDGESVERLLRCADESLYAAKAFGRDRTVIYSREVVGALASGPDGAPAAAGSNLATLLTLAEALDIRDPRTARHSETVGRYAEAMARRLGLEPERVERIRLAAILHDIGKIGVADSILYKAGPLTDEEWAEIRNHPEIGARLLSAPGLGDLRAWVLAHHERVDGGGYPLGLSGDEIPLEARIIAVADAFEAMLADRPYRVGRPREQALAELERCGGTQFDPQVVGALAGVQTTA
jgi:two-component system cell cycle response regulator